MSGPVFKRLTHPWNSKAHKVVWVSLTEFLAKITSLDELLSRFKIFNIGPN